MRYKINKFDVIAGVVMFLVVLLIFIIKEHEDKRQRIYLNKKYKNVNLSTEIQGIVKNTYYPPEWRGGGYNQQFVTLTNGKNYNIYVEEFLKVESEHLGNFIKPGAKIIKHKGTDSIIILFKGRQNVVQIYNKSE